MLKAQAKEEPAATTKKLTKKLNEVYDKFVEKFGFVNLPANLRAIIDDPEAPRILALENWNDETGEATKSDIFSKKFIENLKPVTSVAKPTDAIPHSLNALGRIDIPYIANLSGVSEDEAIKELKGEIWNDPEKGWVPSDEYLSGNIKEKIALAEQAAKSDPIYKENVKALTPLIPEDLPPSK
ncbi:MAG: DNA methylase, partial [Gammaproteobacteria bacterium]|nr:DNA methylase [Gammaproteobacteria bacterium]